MNGDLAPFVGCLPRCYRARVSAVSLCSVSHTWPESGTGYVTLTSCRTLTPVQIEAVGETVRQRLQAQQVISSGTTL